MIKGRDVKKSVRWELMLAAALFACACGPAEVDRTRPRRPPAIAVAVSPGSPSVSVGGKQQFYRDRNRNLEHLGLPGRYKRAMVEPLIRLATTRRQ